MNSEDVQHFETVFAGRFEKSACLVGGESLYLLRSWSRRLCWLGHVSRDEVPIHGLREAPAQDVVQLVDRRAAEARVEPVAVEALDVRRVELFELQPTEDRLDVVVDEVGIKEQKA